MEADPHYDLAQALDLTLSCIKAASMSTDTNTEQRDALRYLHERIINYYGLMRSRRLTASVEFLIPYHDGKLGCTTAGWYWASPANTTGAIVDRKHNRNWNGPYGSRKLAVAARDKDKPKSRVELSFQQLDAMAD